MSDLYEEIGVPKAASKADIKRAYRKKAQKVHPDKGGEPGAFERLNKAFLLLTDDGRRAEYDRTGTTEAAPDPRAEMLNAVAQLIIGLAMENSGDIIKQAGHQLEQQIYGVTGQIRQMKQQIDKLTKTKGKIKFKGKGEPLVHLMLDQHIASLRENIANAERAVTKCQDMMKMLMEYEFVGAAEHPSMNHMGSPMMASFVRPHFR